MPRPPALRVEAVTTLAMLGRLAGPLADLAVAADGTVFDQPAFFLPWTQAAVANGQRPACLALYRGGVLCGFVPLFARRDPRGLFGRVLAPPRYGSSPPFDLLLAGVDAPEAIATLGAALGARGWIMQDIRADIAGSRLGGVWADWFAASGHPVVRQPGPDYFRFTNVGSVADFNAALPRKTRMECERLMRRLDGAGAVRLVTGAGAITPALAAMHDIIGQSWKGSPEMARRGWAMLQAVARSMAGAGMLRLWLAEAEGRPIAYLMEFEDHNRHRHAFHNAQVEAAGRFNPGILILYNALAAAHVDGAPVYEFWGHRSYLRRFANGVCQTRSVRIDNPGLRLRVRQLLARRQPGTAGHGGHGHGGHGGPRHGGSGHG